MDVFASLIIQSAGLYVLYSASDRTVFVKRKLNVLLYQHQTFSKVIASIMLSGSLIMFMVQLGIGVGSLFALTSLMTLSAMMIMLFPLKKA